MKHLILVVLSLFLLAAPSFADSDVDCQVVAEAIDPTEAQGTNDYINLTDGTFGTTHAADDEFRVPVDMKAWGLSAVVNAAPGSGDIWTVSLIDDNVNTGLTCTISGTATSCSSASNVVRGVAAGSTLTALVSSSAGATDPDAAGEILVSFCLDR